MESDLKLKRLSENTRKEYLRCARDFVAFYDQPAQELHEDDVRRYLLHLVEVRNLPPRTTRCTWRRLSSSSASPSVGPMSRSTFPGQRSPRGCLRCSPSNRSMTCSRPRLARCTATPSWSPTALGCASPRP